MVSKDALVVASGYADYKRFDGLNTSDLVQAGRDAECDVVMVDTAMKDGKTLFDVLTYNEIEDFVGMAKDASLLVALAGSIKAHHADQLIKLDPDIIGVRGAVCESTTDRKSKISPEKTVSFMKLFRDTSEESRLEVH